MVLNFGRKEQREEYFCSDGGMKGQRSGPKVNDLGLKMQIALSRNVLICIQVLFDYHVDEC